MRLLRLSLLRWMFLVLAASAVVGVWSPPVVSQSDNPCDSPTVVPSGASALREDCYALWEFYTGLDDPGLLDHERVTEGWLTVNWAAYPGSVGIGAEYVWRRWGPDNPVSEWYGVMVESGRVTLLGLEGAGISGPLSPSLGRLSALRYLHTSGAANLPDRSPGDSANAWTGSIPKELGKLTNLVELTIGGVSGSIPPELGNLTRLQLLTADESNLVGPCPGSAREPFPSDLG